MAQHKFDPLDSATWRPAYIDVLTYLDPGDVILLISPVDGRFTVALTNSLQLLDGTLPEEQQRVTGVTVMSKTLGRDTHIDARLEHLAIPRMIVWDSMRDQFPYWLYPDTEMEECRSITTLESLYVVRHGQMTRLHG